MNDSANARFFRGILLGVATVALALGATLHAVRQADGRLRADLLQQARLVATVINPQEVASLTGTEADLALPDYIQLHERLIFTRLSNPSCRFLYLMRRAPDGRVFFIVDSERPDSEGNTPPGETYDEAPDELHVVFATGQAAVRGPYPDRWGSWISAFVPLPGPATDGMETVLGMDIDAGKWKRTVALHAAPPAVLTFLVVLLGLLARALHQSGRNLRAHQAKLQENERKAQQDHMFSKAVIDSIPGTFYMVGTDGRYVGWNAYQRDEIAGKPESEMTDMYAIDTIHPDDRALISTRITNVLKDGGEECVEGRVLVRGGPDFRWFLMTGRQMLIQGSPVLIGIGIDITERKRTEEALRAAQCETERLLAEARESRRALLGVVEDQKEADAALRESEERFRTANNASLDALILLRSDRDEAGEIRDFVFVDLNRRTEEMLHMSRERLLGQRLCDELPINREAGFFEKYKRVVETGIPLEEEFFLPETHLPAAWNYHQVVRVGDGVFICHRDIGDRKRAEEERDKLQTQFLQAQKMESVGRLAGGVAHDFNNMLMGVMGYAELCREQIAPDNPANEWLHEIIRESQRAANLTRQLLAFARKQTIAPQVLDLNDAVGNMLKMLRRLIGEDIDLVWHPGTGLWMAKLDTGQVDQILANLCINARDAIGGNAGKLTIETENVTIDAAYCAEYVEASPGDYVMLAVSDDGCGMDQATLANIFEPFFTTKKLGEGTGLGLATVHGIVTQNKGFINVYSEPGKGTTFRIYLPRVVAETVVQAQAATEVPRPGGTETILLVEDDKAVRFTLNLFLKELGYTVLAADSPETALSITVKNKGRIDLLLTDVVMPGMSGRELVGKLAPDYPAMKVLYMSGYTASVIAHRGILDEGVNFISKPVSRDVLAAKVREVLE